MMSLNNLQGVQCVAYFVVHDVCNVASVGIERYRSVFLRRTCALFRAIPQQCALYICACKHILRVRVELLYVSLSVSNQEARCRVNDYRHERSTI